MSERQPPAPKRPKPSSRPRRRRRSVAPAAKKLEQGGPAVPGEGGRGVKARWVGSLAGALGFAVFAWLFAVYPQERGPGSGHVVEIVIQRTLSPSDLAAALAAAGLISHPRLFALWVTATGGSAAVVGGTHLLTDDASPRELLARLERRGLGASARVTFPEGYNRFDIARRLEEKHVATVRAFLDAAADPALARELGIDGDGAEGFLFPATYDLPLDDDARDVVRRMKREFDRRWDILSRTHDSSLNDVMTSLHLTVRDVVTLASMVEKEAAVDDERRLVASVFINRLRDPNFRPKHLECDPTAAYGCLVAPESAASCAGFSGRATAAIQHDPDNAYSTYTHEGLPPGPIANPGARSLEAAMSPAPTHYFFFVARGEGRHAFSETYAAHLAALHATGSRVSVSNP